MDEEQQRKASRFIPDFSARVEAVFDKLNQQLEEIDREAKTFKLEDVYKKAFKMYSPYYLLEKFSNRLSFIQTEAIYHRQNMGRKTRIKQLEYLAPRFRGVVFDIKMLLKQLEPRTTVLYAHAKRIGGFVALNNQKKGSTLTGRMMKTVKGVAEFFKASWAKRFDSTSISEADMKKALTRILQVEIPRSKSKCYEHLANILNNIAKEVRELDMKEEYHPRNLQGVDCEKWKGDILEDSPYNVYNPQTGHFEIAPDNTDPARWTMSLVIRRVIETGNDTIHEVITYENFPEEKVEELTNLDMAAVEEEAGEIIDRIFQEFADNDEERSSV